MANAQNAEPADKPSEQEPAKTDEIVVTGTLLRGAAPVGSNLISVGEQKLAESGATTSNELLATVPQVSNLFNNVPTARLNVAVNQIQVVRPNLRNLSPETGSSPSTLVLFDGHRIANVGVSQAQVDPDLIPTGAIERVEVVTDGGSATYGADAVGGVINFITRKRFDGLKVESRYGFADDYNTWDASVTAGKDWGSGSLFASYSYQQNDALFGRDRDFIRRIDWVNASLTPLPLRDFTCAPGNVRIGSGSAQQIYPITSAAPTFGAGSLVTVGGLPSATTANRCDTSDNTSFIPEAHRHGALAGLHQELANWLTVDLRAFYGARSTTAFSPFFRTVTVTPSNNPAYYKQVPGTSPTASQSVDVDFSPVVGPSPQRQTSSFQEWGANAEFEARPDDNWSVRQLFNYSRSNSEFHIIGPRSTLSPSTIGATTFNTINFYNPAATPAPILALLNNEQTAGQGKDEQLNLRTIVDGTLLTLPGGDVKLAAGYEYLYEGFQQRTASDVVIGGLSSSRYGKYGRRVNSLFGEVQVPIIGPDNRFGGVYSLTLAASARYDHFSDFGGTTNPKFGVTLKPVSWLALRGNYSTSFNAPSVVDQLRSQSPTLLSSSFLALRGTDTCPGCQSLSLQGAAPDLKPQTATTYSFGFDLDPPFVNGLHLSATYYNVAYKGLLGQPPAQSANLLFAQFSDLVFQNPTFGTANPNNNFLTAQPVAGLIAQGINPSVANAFINSNTLVYQFLDFRTRNFGQLKVSGIDFSANYRVATGFGGIDAGVSGNYQLSRKSLPNPGGTEVDLLVASAVNTNASSRLQLQATLGADIGNFRAQATLNHSSGYALFRNNSNLPQDHVDDFNVVNLFFRYNVPGTSMLLKDLSFTLNVNNVFDQAPPLWLATSGSTPNGFANGFTVGRLVQVGVTKKF